MPPKFRGHSGGIGEVHRDRQGGQSRAGERGPPGARGGSQDRRPGGAARRRRARAADKEVERGGTRTAPRGSTPETGPDARSVCSVTISSWSEPANDPRCRTAPPLRAEQDGKRTCWTVPTDTSSTRHGGPVLGHAIGDPVVILHAGVRTGTRCAPTSLSCCRPSSADLQPIRAPASASARSAATRPTSRSRSASVMPGRRQTVNTTSAPASSAGHPHRHGRRITDHGRHVVEDAELVARGEDDPVVRPRPAAHTRRFAGSTRRRRRPPASGRCAR